MQAYIGGDADSGLAHHVHGPTSNVADMKEVAQLLHGNENIICADASYTGVGKRSGREGEAGDIWQIAVRRSTTST